MRREGNYKGYKYEISKSLITLREIDKSVDTKEGTQIINIVRELLIGDIPSGVFIMLHVIPNNRWYNIKTKEGYVSRRNKDLIDSIKKSRPIP
jgi:hypothetical protein